MLQTPLFRNSKNLLCRKLKRRFDLINRVLLMDPPLYDTRVIFIIFQSLSICLIR